MCSAVCIKQINCVLCNCGPRLYISWVNKLSLWGVSSGTTRLHTVKGAPEKGPEPLTAPRALRKGSSLLGGENAEDTFCIHCTVCKIVCGQIKLIMAGLCSESTLSNE